MRDEKARRSRNVAKSGSAPDLAMFPEQNPFPVLRIERTGKILYANPAARPLVKAWKSAVGNGAPDLWRRAAAEVLASGKPRTMEASARGVVYSITIAPVKGASYVNLYGADITVRKASEETTAAHAGRLQLLAEAAEAIAEETTGDVAGVVRSVARRLSDEFADVCEIRLLSSDAHMLERAAVASRNRRLLKELEAVKEVPISKDGRPPVELQLPRKGRPLLVNGPEVEKVVAGIVPGYRAAFARRPPHSLIVAPMRSRGLMTGCVCLVRFRGESAPFTKDDASLAQTLADRIALAVSNTRLFGDLRKEMADREHAEERVLKQNRILRLLREIDVAILEAGSVEKVVALVLGQVASLTGCRRVSLTLFDWETNEVVAFDLSSKGAVLAKGGRIPMSRVGARFRTLKRGLPVIVADLSKARALSVQEEALLEHGMRSVCGLPLLLEGVLVGSLNMVSDLPGFFGEEVLEIGREVAGQLAIALSQNRLIDALRASEHRFSVLFEKAAIPAVLLRLPEYVFVDANEAWTTLFGYTKEEIVGRTSAALGINRDAALRKRLQGEVARGEMVRGAEQTLYDKSGTPRLFLTNMSRISLDGRDYAITSLQDISERRQAEERIERLSRTHAVLSGINQLIVRERDRPHLLAEACRIAVEEGDFLMCWIGLMPQGSTAILPVAHAGSSEGYVEGLCLDIGDPLAQSSVTVTAVREAREAVSGDIALDERLAPWREQALARGYRSSGAFPLMQGERCIGAVNFYSGEVDFFDDDEVKLLRELAMDISFALKSIDTENERDRAAQELAFRNLLLSTQMETSIDGILVVDENARILSYNRRFIELWQLPDELIEAGDDRPVLQFVADNVVDPAAFIGKVRDLYEHQRETSRDEIILKRGAIIDRYSAPMFGADDRYYGRVWYFRDVTMRRLSERALEDSERKYRLLAESSREMIYVITKAGRVVYLNSAAARLIGSDVESLSGKHLSEIFPPAAAAENLRNIHGVIETGSPLLRESVQYYPSGPRWVESRLSPIFDEHGKVDSVLGLSFDISERKRAEESLVRLNMAVEASGEAIFMTDPSGVFTFVNRAFTRLYGYDSDEVVGSVTPRILNSGKQSAAQFAEHWRALLAKQTTTSEWINKKKDGSLVTVEDTSDPILNDHGEIAGFLAIQRDVTERRSLEDQIRQTQKMESLGTLASGVAHDFNNVLAIILGHVSILEAHRLDGKHFETSLEAISKASWRGASLVGQMLTFARKSTVEVRPLIINEQVQEVEKLLQETFPKTITFTFDLAPSLPLIDADPTQIQQVLVNLCVNARDAMEGNGSLRVATGIAELESLRGRFADANASGYIRVDVSDTGTGMDDATMKRIFEPFFTTKEPGKGTGLGLAVVFGIMQSHGGFVDVASAPGSGATFSVYFPFKAEPAGASAEGAPAEGALPGGTETILLVEDEELLRESLRSSLENRGYTVVSAGDGPAAIEVFERCKGDIALVICDHGLPQFSGREVHRRLRAIDPAVKFILASGYVEPAERFALASEGMRELLQKPFSASDLLLRVRRLLDA